MCAMCLETIFQNSNFQHSQNEILKPKSDHLVEDDDNPNMSMSKVKKMKFLAALYLCVAHIALIAPSSDAEKKEDGKPRIVGGETCSRSVPHKFMVAILTINKEPNCGGTLLNAYWVLTAAHCLSRTSSRYVLAGVSTYKLDPDSDKFTLVRVAGYYQHGWYSKSTAEYDIGLLNLADPIRKSRNIEYVNLPAFDRNRDINDFCKMGTALGWGLTEHFTDKAADRLQCVDLDIISLDTCQSTWGPRANIVCTMTQAKSISSGDSGGPLMCKGFQEGISSFMHGTDPDNNPAVFTRVDKYVKWINLAIKEGRSTSTYSSYPSLEVYIVCIILYACCY